MQRSSGVDWTGFQRVRDKNNRNIIRDSVCKRCERLIDGFGKEKFDKHRRSCPGRLPDSDNQQQMTDDSSAESDNERFLQDWKEEIDGILGMWFFSASIPFRAVENPYFHKLVQKLLDCPFEYKLPCRQTLAGPILDRIAKIASERKKELFDSTPGVLLVDAWKNKVTNRKFLTFTIRNIRIPQAYLTSYNISLEREDGDTLAAYINSAIDLAKSKYNTDIFAIITDNDSKIKKGGSLSETHSLEKLWQTTCSSHSANLLIKSFVDPDLMKKIRTIVTAFKDPKLDSLLEREGGTKLQNYPDTRFGYLRKSYASVHKSLSAVQNVCFYDDVDLEIIEDVCDPNLKPQLEEALSYLEPICKLINTCQGPFCNAADAVEQWLSLKLPTDKYDRLLEARIEKALHPVSYAAYMLHPSYKGYLLNDRQRKKGDTFIDEHLDLEGKEELQKYKDQPEKFKFLLEKCGSDCIAFWSLMELKLPKLANFGLKLMIIPASTALIEGLFSSWTYIHTVVRNRLKEKRSSDLLDVYHSLHFVNPADGYGVRKRKKSKHRYLYAYNKAD